MSLPLPHHPVADLELRRNLEALHLAIDRPVPQARVYNNAALAIANLTNTVLTFNSERWDDGSLHSTAANTGRLTASVTGLWSFGANIEFEANATGHRGIYVRLNGATIIAFDNRMTVTTAAEPTRVHVAGEYRLVAGDYIEVLAQQNSGGALNVNAAGNYSPEFWMVRLAGYAGEQYTR